MIIDVRMNGEDGSVEYIHLAIFLRLACLCEIFVNVQDLAHFVEEFGSELCSLVSDEVIRWAVVEYQIIEEIFGSFSC